MKKLMKLLWAWFLYYSRFLDFYLWARDIFTGGHVTVLLYHRIIPGENSKECISLPGIVVHQDSFVKHMRFLSENYNVISIDNFLTYRKKRLKLPKKAVLITFDDGWQDNYKYAFPVLKTFNLPAIIFLTAGFIGTINLFWQERLIYLIKILSTSESMPVDFLEKCNLLECQQLISILIRDPEDKKSLLRLITHLKQIDETSRENLIRTLELITNKKELHDNERFILDWEQVKEMIEGNIDFGSHGISHRILTMFDDQIIRNELVKSKDLIEIKTGEPIRTFSYPNGNYSNTVINYVKEAGYDLAFTVDHGINTLQTDPYRLKRINIHEERFAGFKKSFSKELFAVYLAGLL